MPTNLTDIVMGLIESIQGGHWSIFASVFIMLLVTTVTKIPVISKMIKGKAKVWIAAISGMLMATAMTAFSTEGDWVRAIVDGLSVGLGATGFFELVRRKVTHEPIDEDNDGVLDELPEQD